MKKVLRIVVYLVLTPVVLFLLFLVYSTLSDYKPNPIENVCKSNGSVVDVNDTLNIFNWNIGYCGLGDDMSFFYDGGDRMRTTLERTSKNKENILHQIGLHDSIDFFLFQEVDKDSRRSYRINQYDAIKSQLENYKDYYACNYKATFIPLPVTNPLGKTYSGLASYSKYEAFNVDRHAFEGNYTWPKSLFLLDRCFMVQRFYTSNGKELLIINTHNSAYDDGSLRLKQMAMMRDFLLSEYKKGNYIVVGGDWNQNPPKEGAAVSMQKEEHLTRVRIGEDFMPEGWQWAFCEDISTNRLINEAYNPESTITTTIDFFLVSPNVQKLTLKNIDLAFKNSDHNPVLLTFSFVN